MLKKHPQSETNDSPVICVLDRPDVKILPSARPACVLPPLLALCLSHSHACTHTRACTHALCHLFQSLLTWILLPVTLSPGSPHCPLLSDKLFGKRLLQARHYIMSRKSWLKMVPTENCDILMTFPGAVSFPLVC